MNSREIGNMGSKNAKSGTLLIGYDTEAWWAPDETLQFLEIVERVHKELHAPCLSWARFWR